ncbi:M48 family metalloprotease [Thermodesulfobacteriota bacterium]
MPKEIEGNVNVSHNNPLKEFFTLLGGLFGIALFVYIILGFAVDRIVPILPVEVEDYIGSMFSDSFDEAPKTAGDYELQALLDGISNKASHEKGHYKVFVLDDLKLEDKIIEGMDLSKPNAAAFPGRLIMVTKSLLKESDSENALAFVLCHELGHYANKDHLRGLI